MQRIAKALGQTPFVDNLYRSFDSALLVVRSFAALDEEFARHECVVELLQRCDEFLRHRSERGPLSFRGRRVIVIEGIDATGKVGRRLRGICCCMRLIGWWLGGKLVSNPDGSRVVTGSGEWVMRSMLACLTVAVI